MVFRLERYIEVSTGLDAVGHDKDGAQGGIVNLEQVRIA